MDQVQAMFFLALSWLKIKPETIKNCWKHTNILDLLSKEASSVSDETVIDIPTTALPLEVEVTSELSELLENLPGNTNKEISSVEDLDLETGETDMMLFPDFEHGMDEDNEDDEDTEDTDEITILEEEPTDSEILEQKKILRESFENILRYDIAMSEFDLLVHRRI